MKRPGPRFFCLPVLALVAFLGGGCTSTRVPSPATFGFALDDSCTCTAFAALPAAQQRARHRQADRLWRRYLAGRRARTNRWQEAPLAWEIEQLTGIVRSDPTRAEALIWLGERWHWLRRNRQAATAWQRALAVLPCASAAAPDTLRERALLDLAWLAYDEGDWAQGLDLLARHGSPWSPRHLQELRVLRGLLQAGAGHAEQALDAARRLPPTVYNRVTSSDYVAGAPAEGVVWHRPARSGYAARWIRARLWLSLGDAQMARHALGHLAFTRTTFPFMVRYWNDVGMVDELAGDTTTARLAYGLAVASDAPWRRRVPFRGSACTPIIHGHPAVSIPYYATLDGRYYLGSRFAMAANLVAATGNAPDSATARRLGDRALALLDRCRRLAIRPLDCLALRGRVLYATGQRDAALAVLSAAHDSLAAHDRPPDPTTSLLLGALLVERDREREALPCLRECLAREPGRADAWRVLGAALAGTDSLGAALSAFDHAVTLDPRSPSALYNRGRLLAGLGRWEDSLADLSLAAHLDSADARIPALRQQVVALAGHDLGADRLARLRVRADSLAGEPSLARASGKAVPARAPTAATMDTAATDSLLRLESGRRQHWRARADSLATAYRSTPGPALRSELAAAWIEAGEPRRALALLAPAWPGGLAPRERRMVLRCDRELGEADRALASAQALRVNPEAPPDDPIFWSLVSLCCLDHGDREEGLAALHRALTLDPRNRDLRAFLQHWESQR